MSLRPTWIAHWVQGQPELHSKILSQRERGGREGRREGGRGREREMQRYTQGNMSKRERNNGGRMQ